MLYSLLLLQLIPFLPLSGALVLPGRVERGSNNDTILTSDLTSDSIGNSTSDLTSDSIGNSTSDLTSGPIIGPNEPSVTAETITFPDEVKKLPVPSWLNSWEDAELGTLQSGFDTPLGDDKEDVKLRAAYWLMSMTGGSWLSSKNNETVKRSLDFELDEAALTYLETGDQEVLRQKLFDYGLINWSANTTLITDYEDQEVVKSEPVADL